MQRFNQKLSMALMVVGITLVGSAVFAKGGGHGRGHGGHGHHGHHGHRAHHSHHRHNAHHHYYGGYSYGSDFGGERDVGEVDDVPAYREYVAAEPVAMESSCDCDSGVGEVGVGDAEIGGYSSMYGYGGHHHHHRHHGRSAHHGRHGRGGHGRGGHGRR